MWHPAPSYGWQRPPVPLPIFAVRMSLESFAPLLRRGSGLGLARARSRGGARLGRHRVSAQEPGRSRGSSSFAAFPLFRGPLGAVPVLAVRGPPLPKARISPFMGSYPLLCPPPPPLWQSLHPRGADAPAASSAKDSPQKPKGRSASFLRKSSRLGCEVVNLQRQAGEGGRGRGSFGRVSLLYRGVRGNVHVSCM